MKILPYDLGLSPCQVGNADHGVSGFFLGDCHELALSVDPDSAVLVHLIADHIPGIGFCAGIRVDRAPDVAGDDVGVVDPAGDISE